MKIKYKPRVDIIDMVGKKSGDLTIISNVGPGKYRGSRWLCRCKCGVECIVYGGHLRNNTRKSCGCLSEAKIDATGVNRIYHNYKRKAFLRKLTFNLPKDIFEKLIKGNCSYCGSEPTQILKRLKSKKLQIIYNGIDRVDSSIGYEINNCVSCCRYCNQSKSDLTVDQWKIYIKKVVKWLQIDFL